MVQLGYIPRKGVRYTMRLAFTGHRPESLPFGENELSASAIRVKAMLADEIMRCAAQGYDTFLAGGARGGDIKNHEFTIYRED